MHRRLYSGMVLVAAIWFAQPATASAQSAIAGVVRDSSGAVIPGVTVEATSPALIEKVRSVVTDEAGQYRIVELRPGTYAVTFTLPGFTTVRREGIELEANFTAPLNVEMRVGTVEETLTVTGQTPIVDVQTTVRREVLNRDVLDALPTGRNYMTIGATLPAVSMGRFDVAGSTAMQQASVTVYGSLGGDMGLEVDGMSVQSSLSSGSTPAVYHNDGAYQEYVFQVSGGTAESQTGGVRINMIPKEGGNRFSGSVVGLFSNTDLQGTNMTDELRARGLEAPAALYRLHDVNGSLGGPILRDRLWFFTSVRNWAYNAYVANAFNPDGTQAADDNLIEAYTNRLTSQLTQRNKITAMYDKLPKYRGHREIEIGGIEPKATVVQTTPLSYNAQAKWTSPVTDKLLLEAGFSEQYYNYWLSYQPEVRRATCFVAFASCPAGTDYGDITKIDIIRMTRSNAALRDFHDWFPKYNIVSSVSYVTGTHALKAGVQYGWGWIKSWREVNGSLYQRYRNGVPDSVDVRNSPVLSDSKLDLDLGIYVQDSWTFNRLTLNPGIRFEALRGSVPAQDIGPGRFVPARRFDEIPNLPNWKDVAPRFGAAYDVFGNGRTAIKGSIGKYMQQEQTGYPARYNPMVESTDRRTWTDRNGDDIAQENELGPSTNVNFGVRRNRNPDPDIKRPYQLLYNIGVQHEVWAGISASVNYYRRGFYRMIWTDNLAATLNDYAPVTIPDPRGNGEMLTVYNISRSAFGSINELDTNSSTNKRTFDGVDITVNSRLGRGATLLGGVAIGRTREVGCELEDPNYTAAATPGLRFCDQKRDVDMPFLTTFKLSGSYPLPYGVRLSGVFQSALGEPINMTYLVNRTIVPTLTAAEVTARLNRPGEDYYDRNNQLDFTVSKEFRVRAVRIRPQIDLFNALNASPVVSQVATFGSSLGRPLRVLDARLVRLGVQVDF
jgi:hypothetical protein